MNYKEFLDSLPIITYQEKWEPYYPFPHGSCLGCFINKHEKPDPIIYNIPTPQERILTITDWISDVPHSEKSEFLGANLKYDPIRLGGLNVRLEPDYIELACEYIFREGGLPDIALQANNLDLEGKFIIGEGWDKNRQEYKSHRVLPVKVITVDFLKPNTFLLLTSTTWKHMEKDGLKTLVCSSPGYNLYGIIEYETNS